jgi:hypothetical protein
VTDFITTVGADAQIFACAEAHGDDVRIKVVNNRAFPVNLELSAQPRDVHFDLAWPPGFADLYHRIQAAADSTGKTIVLPPFGQMELAYAQPERSIQLTGYVHVSIIDAMVNVLLDTTLELVDLDVKLPAGMSLGLSTLDCFLRIISAEHDVISTGFDPDRVLAAINTLSGCMKEVVTTERNAITPADKHYGFLSKTLDVLKWYTLAKGGAKITELFLDRRGGIDNTVDLSLVMDSVKTILVDFAHIGPFNLGMTLDQVRQAAGVDLDREQHCAAAYSFHGERAWGQGDGPMFFFDDNGRLLGMLLGKTAFHRIAQTATGARFGTTLADLQRQYGAALIPPGHADSPDLTWVKGPQGTAIGFELEAGNTIHGFRTGAESFVTQLEFCS